MLLEREFNPSLVCIKYLLVIFNLLFVITGICMILVAWAINSIYFEYSHFLDNSYFSPVTLLFTTGVIVFLVAFFGCYGAYKESTCMIMVFSLCLAIVFVLEITVAVAGYIMQGQVREVLSYAINTTMNDYPYNNASARTIDMLQEELHCCGVKSSEDWRGILPLTDNGTHIQLPESCCALFDKNKTCLHVTDRGCLPQLEFLIRESSILISGTAIAIAALQLIGVMFACSLGRMLRFQKTERERQRWEMREQLISNYTQGEKGPVMYMTVTDVKPKK